MINNLQPQNPLLVVDDEPEVRELLSLLLESEGFVVETAENGEQALRKFGQHGWSAVLTDRMMPGMSGDELAASIRRVDPHVPIILVSGHAFDRVGFEFQAVIAKPFTTKTLQAALQAVLAAPREIAG